MDSENARETSQGSLSRRQCASQSREQVVVDNTAGNGVNSPAMRNIAAKRIKNEKKAFIMRRIDLIEREIIELQNCIEANIQAARERLSRIPWLYNRATEGDAQAEQLINMGDMQCIVGINDRQIGIRAAHSSLDQAQKNISEGLALIAASYGDRQSAEEADQQIRTLMTQVISLSAYTGDKKRELEMLRREVTKIEEQIVLLDRDLEAK